MPYDYDAIRKRAKELESDGCTGVRDFRVDCCYHHDIMWRTGHTIDGCPVTPREANRIFRECIQERSWLGKFSPMSWIRWAGVSLVALFRPPTPSHPFQPLAAAVVEEVVSAVTATEKK